MAIKFEGVESNSRNYGRLEENVDLSTGPPCRLQTRCISGMVEAVAVVGAGTVLRDSKSLWRQPIISM